MIMYLAALKSVPEQLYEAASIDGANWWQRIWFVTLPMMRNIIAITALFSTDRDLRQLRHRARAHIGRPARPRRTSSPPGRSRSASRAATSRSAPPCRCSWCRSWPWRLPSSCATSTSAGVRSDGRRRNRHRRPVRAVHVRQHEPRPPLGDALVVLLPGAVCDLLPDAAALHAADLAEDQREISAATNPWWVYHPTLENYIDAAEQERIPDLLPQLGAGLDLRRVASRW